MRKTDWLFVLLMIFICGVAIARVEYLQGNFETPPTLQGNQSFADVSGYLCSLANAKAWDVSWEDEPNVITHAIYDEHGEKMADVLILYRKFPENPEEEMDVNKSTD